MKNTAILVWVYAALVAGGGVMGYLKARSKASLISGVGFGGLLGVAGFGVWQENTAALVAAAVMAALLVVLFAVRYAKTRRFMPLGLMAVLSMAALMVFVMALPGR
jgi:uncharacterized membrane protein (UPF0136 family)